MCSANFNERCGRALGNRKLRFISMCQRDYTQTLLSSCQINLQDSGKVIGEDLLVLMNR